MSATRRICRYDQTVGASTKDPSIGAAIRRKSDVSQTRQENDQPGKKR